jgi:uncharacterized membrane protein YfcA
MLTMFIGSTVQTTCGFGNGILVMTVFPFLLPFSQSAAISSMASVLLSSLIAVRSRKFIRFDVLWPLLLSGIAVSSGVIFLAVGKSDKLLIRMLGGLLILLSLYFIFFDGKIRIKPSCTNGVAAGILGGIGGGLFSIAAPPVVVYLLSSLDLKEEYRATVTAYFAITGLSMTIVRALNGIVTWQLLKTFSAMSIAIVAGVLLGNRIFDRINVRLLRRLVYLVMAVSGLAMLF